MKKALQKIYSKDGQDRLLPRLSLKIFKHSRTVAIIWLCLTLFGIYSYTNLMKREGFPSVDIPFAVATGTYFVNDAAKVDREVAKPVSDIAMKDDRVKSVQTSARGSFYSAVLQFKEGTNAEAASKEIKQRVADAKILPAQATIAVEAPKIGFTNRGDDVVISVYAAKEGPSAAALVAEAEKVVEHIKSKKLADIENVSVIDPFVKGIDPATGASVTDQVHFDRYAQREGERNVFYNSVSVGIMQREGTDVIKLDEQLQTAVDEYNAAHKDSDFKSVISATYAHDIKDQISELQHELLLGLLAVLIVGSVVIAIRASLVTVLAMITVLAVAIGFLFTIGYTLNTITLFSLILCLGLIVDDTIIMVEALDAQRRKRKDAAETVKVATQKVSRAMVAATTTAILSFAPLLFVGGILGGFIRAIPVTIISALAISLLVALVFIPFFAKYLLLGKKQMGDGNVHEPAAKIEAGIAHLIVRPMLWARHSRPKLFAVGIAAIVFAFTFIGAGGWLSQKVAFNIFPPSKDGNGLMVRLAFAPGITIEQAQAITAKADNITAETLGENFKYATYYSNTSAQNATLNAYIISYKERDITSVQLAEQLSDKFKDFTDARVEVAQMDIGPPVSTFGVNVQTSDREAGLKLANDIKQHLSTVELTRPSGEKARFTEVDVSDPTEFARKDGKSYVSIIAKFDGTDTSTLVALAQDNLNNTFSEQRLKQYGLDKDTLQYDLGQEAENQESFGSLLMAFPILLLVIYLVLSIQFRSLLQPLLIFMAIPFSFLGITLGLYLSNNAFSFFAMLGFFALVGLSIKNTILLTDYANQLRREGVSAVDAAVGALSERFRPLVATSLTAVASLIPLALTSPFWEGLAVVLIGGLLSSTMLVILVFPYFYLGAEYLRMRVSRAAALLWIMLTVLITFILVKAGLSAGVLPLVALVVALAQARFVKLRRTRRNAKAS